MVFWSGNSSRLLKNNAPKEVAVSGARISGAVNLALITLLSNIFFYGKTKIFSWPQINEDITDNVALDDAKKAAGDPINPAKKTV